MCTKYTIMFLFFQNGLEHVHLVTLQFVDKGKEYIIDLSLNKYV